MRSATAIMISAVVPYTTMYQTAVNDETRLSRTAGPVCITRFEMRPAKSFWKNAQLCRTTCQWLCQRIRLENGPASAWLVTI